MKAMLIRLALTAALVAVLGSVSGLLRTQVASAATKTAAVPAAATHSLYGQCGGAVHNGPQLYAGWVHAGITSQVIVNPHWLKYSGFHRMDEPLQTFMGRRVVVIILTHSILVEDFGCKAGKMFSVGLRTIPAGTPVAIVLPPQYTKAQISTTPRAGYKAQSFIVGVVGKGDCTNPLAGNMQVTLYVKQGKTVAPPSHLKATLLKTALVDGKAVPGLGFVIREFHGKKVVASWGVLSSTKRTVNPKYLNDSFCEVLKAPWHNPTPCDKFTTSGQLLRWTNTQTTATTPKTAVCTMPNGTVAYTLPPGYIVQNNQCVNIAQQNCQIAEGSWNPNTQMCTIIQVVGQCTNVVIVNGNGNTVSTSQQGNCNTNTGGGGSNPPQQCPSGTQGTYPNCGTCPAHYTGTYPNCQAPPKPTITDMYQLNAQSVYEGNSYQLCASVSAQSGDSLTVTFGTGTPGHPGIGTLSATSFSVTGSGQVCTTYTAPGETGTDTYTVYVHDNTTNTDADPVSATSWQVQAQPSNR